MVELLQGCLVRVVLLGLLASLVYVRYNARAMKSLRSLAIEGKCTSLTHLFRPLVFLRRQPSRLLSRARD